MASGYAPHGEAPVESEELEEGRRHEGAAGGGAEEDDEEEGREEAPTHLPLAPSSELLDTTTIDPSYIISLIRKILPNNARTQILSRKLAGNLDSVETSELCPAEARMVLGSDCMKKAVEKEADDIPVSHSNLKDSFEGSDYQTYLDTSSLYNGKELYVEQEERSSNADHDWELGLTEMENTREESGCILWDLSANRTHAELMVNNFLLDVLLASVCASQSSRITEICLGILGNLACHDVSSDAMISKDGLVETVVDQVFINESTCLCEVFRLLVAALQGNGSTCWAKALLPEQVRLRIIWIVDNTLNTMLLEKSIEFLLTIINNQEVAAVLLQPFIKLGLPKLVVNLLACQVNSLEDESRTERKAVLELILSLVEALSTLDCSFEVTFPNEELCHLVCRVIKLPGKFEFSRSCVSAVVTIANLLVDGQHLALQLSRDYEFFEVLIDSFPIVSDDSQARDALWSILASLLVRIPEKDDSISLDLLVSFFLEKSNLLEEDLSSHPPDDSEINPVNSTTISAMITSLERISCITEGWLSGKKEKNEEIANISDVDVKAEMLLHCCNKYCSLLGDSKNSRRIEK